MVNTGCRMRKWFEHFVFAGAVVFTMALVGWPAIARAAMQAAPPTVPSDVKGSAGVKAYLLKVLDQITVANADLTRESAAYAKLIADNGGTPESAAKAQPQQMAQLILQMRDAYQRIDSFGYEYIEGIVAGVPALMKYDAELDAGIPAKG